MAFIHRPYELFIDDVIIWLELSGLFQKVLAFLELFDADHFQTNGKSMGCADVDRHRTFRGKNVFDKKHVCKVRYSSRSPRLGHVKWTLD